MGSAFEIGLVYTDEKKAEELLDKGIAEIERLEDLLSEFKEDSETFRINNFTSGQWHSIDSEVFELILRSQQIARLSQGYFDITVKPLKTLYKFNQKEGRVPSKKVVSDTLQHVGFEKLELNPSEKQIRFLASDMSISFAAIGKGYAADKVTRLWKSFGVEAGYVNASGDLTAFGKRPDTSPWRIGISNPDQRDEMLFYIPVENRSVATSGDYIQHFTQGKTRFSHNINPRTGLPTESLKSVTVVSPSAELSDALATAVMTLGAKKGISLINQLPQTNALVIDQKNQVYFSKDLNYEEVA